MNVHKVQETFVGAGGALATSVTSINTAQIGIFGNNNVNITAGNTIATAGMDSLTIYSALSDGNLKKSFEIKGSEVIGFQAESYQAAKRQVVSIGCKRKTASSGLINVVANTYYTGVIVFKNLKTMYSERPEKFRFSFTTPTSPTQSSVADQIVAAIANSPYGKGVMKQISAIKVGDGTGADGLTGATNYGVEVTSLDVKQFQESSYVDNQVYFSIHLDSNSGFGSTSTVNVIQNFDPGVGTYRQVYVNELRNAGYEGVLQRRMFPIPTIHLNANSAGVLSGNVGTLTVNGTINTDLITVAASTFTAANLEAGSIIVIGSSTYEIKYLIDANNAVLTSNLTATATTATVKAKLFYDLINLTVRSTNVSDGPGIQVACEKMITFATPAIDANATSLTSNSTEGAALLAILNPWVASAPIHLPNVSI